MSPHSTHPLRKLPLAGLVICGLLTADQLGPQWLPYALCGIATAAIAVAAIVWVARVWRRGGLERNQALTLACAAIWPASLAGAQALHANSLYHSIGTFGSWGLFVVGLLWTIWYVEQASREFELARRGVSGRVDALQMAVIGPAGTLGAPIWNPTYLAAWYYGHQHQKLRQSTIVLAAYSLVFVAAGALLALLTGRTELYELPGGGGGGGAAGGAPQQAMAQAVRVQKVVKKKFIINPYSSIKFADRSVDDVKLQLVESTDHLYSIGTGQGGAGSGKGKGFGFGDGEGSGFGNGTADGKVRFIRLEYPGGDWDQDFGVGADLNMLVEYGVRTQQKVADQTESRTIAQLTNFPLGKSPPLVYLTGQRNISLSKSDIKTLREYLVDKHGMMFGDNGGSWNFHAQFFAMMQQVLPNVEPVKVPLDDVIHRVPFPIPFLPYVAPHGGRDAWGWKVDGRWLCYYHPGDIGDAWSDGHSGVPPRVYEACYQLGANVIFYAHMEYAKWLHSRAK